MAFHLMDVIGWAVVLQLTMYTLHKPDVTGWAVVSC